MKKLILICLAATMILAIGNVAYADWIPGDGHKMHYPQTPDSYGWDVAFDSYLDPQPGPIGDDWQCTETGPVTDIHLWVSWANDIACSVTSLDVKIYSNNPSGQGPYEQLWQSTLTLADGDYSVCDYGTGLQGWYDPFENTYTAANDHENFQQINIANIENPFYQTEGEIYWLVISAVWNTEPVHQLGWKTSEDNWGDNAVWYDGYNWQELKYPESDPQNRGGDSIDLAFVITPEPATVVILSIGALSLIRRKK